MPQAQNTISLMRRSKTRRADCVRLSEIEEQTTNNAILPQANVNTHSVRLPETKEQTNSNTHMPFILSTLGSGQPLEGAASMSSTLQNYSLEGAASMPSTFGGSGQSLAPSTFGGSYSLEAQFDYSTTNQSLAASASMSSTLQNYSLEGAASMSSTLQNYSLEGAASMPSLPGVGGQSLGGVAGMLSTLENYSGMPSLPGVGGQSFADSTTQSYMPTLPASNHQQKKKAYKARTKPTKNGKTHGNYGKEQNLITRGRISNGRKTSSDRPLLREQFNHSTTDTTEDWSCNHCPFTKRVGKTSKEGKTTSKGFMTSWARKHLTGVGAGTVSLCPNIPKELKAKIVAAAPKKK